MRRSRWMRWLTFALAAAAVVQEVRKPAEEREWHGRVAGIVPYDFRWPTVARLRSSWWNPEGPLMTRQVFGVGWTLNVGRAARLLREARGASSG